MMKKQFLTILSFFALALTFISGNAWAEKSVANNLVGVQGYDLVSYHGKAPMKGNGHNVVEHKGVTYLFADAANKKAFKASPEKYLPAYGGYCAYGASVGKKFTGDPEVWKIVDGTLYLNLDKKVQRLWSKDISGNITKADTQWKLIKDKTASEL